MPIVNALLVRWAGGFTEFVDAVSIAARGRLEGYVELGAIQSVAEAQTVAETILADLANPRLATSLGIEPAGAEEPYAGFAVADSVSVPGVDGTPSAVRVRSIAVGEDPEGNPIFGVEVGAARKEREERMARWLKALSNGSLGGSVASASRAPGGLSATVVAAPTAAAPAGSLAGSGVTLVTWEAGAPTVGQVSGRLPMPVSRRVNRLDITAVTAAGSGTTTIALRRNGANQATASLAAGSASGYSAGLDVLYEPGQFLDFTITALGTGLVGPLLVAARFG